MRVLLTGLILAAGLLSGCASMRIVDSDVVSVVAAPAGMSLQGAKYRFERLPSQANNPEAGLAEQRDGRLAFIVVPRGGGLYVVLRHD